MDFSDKLKLIENLARLRTEGTLTDDEYASEKAKLLAGERSRLAPELEDSTDALTPTQSIDRADRSYRKSLAAGTVGAIALAIGASLYVARPTSSHPTVSALKVLRSNEDHKLPTTKPAQLTNLEAFVFFTDPSTCEKGPGLEHVFKAMWTDRQTNVPGFGRVRYSKSEPNKDNITTITLPLEGMWHGLHVTRLVGQGEQDTGLGWDQIRFLDAPTKVLAVLRAKGFPLLAVDKQVTLVTEEGEAWAEVKTVTGGAALECGMSI